MRRLKENIARKMTKSSGGTASVRLIIVVGRVNVKGNSSVTRKTRTASVKLRIVVGRTNVKESSSTTPKLRNVESSSALTKGISELILESMIPSTEGTAEMTELTSRGHVIWTRQESVETMILCVRKRQGTGSSPKWT